jgi:hypothetical protein
MRAYPAYHPLNPNTGPQALPPIAPPPPAAAPAAPAPGPSPAGTAGAFGGSGFGSSGGVRTAGYQNAGDRVNASMPYQTAPLPPDPPPPPPAVPGAPMPTATHGFGRMSWNPANWFRSRGHQHMVAMHGAMLGRGMPCEIVGPRADGTRVLICGGSVKMVIDQQGNVLMNAYANPDAY